MNKKGRSNQRSNSVPIYLSEPLFVSLKEPLPEGDFGTKPTDILREGKVAMVRVPLDDMDGSRIFVVTDGEGSVWRYHDILVAGTKFDEELLRWQELKE